MIGNGFLVVSKFIFLQINLPFLIKLSVFYLFLDMYTNIFNLIYKKQLKLIFIYHIQLLLGTRTTLYFIRVQDFKVKYINTKFTLFYLINRDRSFEQ